MRNPVTQRATTRYFIQSLANGLKVLERFGRDQGALTLTDVARPLGLTKTSAYRYLVTLSSLGYVEIDETSRRYRPTMKVFNLGHAVLNALAVPRLAISFLEQISREFGEWTSMAVLDGVEVVYVARTGSKRILSTNIQVGSRLPAYCTALGKVLLAFLPDAEREGRIKSITYTKFTPNTITEADTLRRLLDKVREQGYAVNDQELDVGLWSCAVPVFDKEGKCFAGINISTLSVCADTAEILETFVAALKTASRQITESL